MSGVVARLSKRVRHDLCAAAVGAARAERGPGADGCQDRQADALEAR